MSRYNSLIKRYDEMTIIDAALDTHLVSISKNGAMDRINYISEAILFSILDMFKDFCKTEIFISSRSVLSVEKYYNRDGSELFIPEITDNPCLADLLAYLSNPERNIMFYYNLTTDIADIETEDSDINIEILSLSGLNPGEDNYDTLRNQNTDSVCLSKELIIQFLLDAGVFQFLNEFDLSRFNYSNPLSSSDESDLSRYSVNNLSKALLKNQHSDHNDFKDRLKNPTRKFRSRATWMKYRTKIEGAQKRFHKSLAGRRFHSNLGKAMTN